MSLRARLGKIDKPQRLKPDANGRSVLNLRLDVDTIYKFDLLAHHFDVGRVRMITALIEETFEAENLTLDD